MLLFEKLNRIKFINAKIKTVVNGNVIILREQTLFSSYSWERDINMIIIYMSQIIYEEAIKQYLWILGQTFDLEAAIFFYFFFGFFGMCLLLSWNGKHQLHIID